MLHQEPSYPVGYIGSLYLLDGSGWPLSPPPSSDLLVAVFIVVTACLPTWHRFASARRGVRFVFLVAFLPAASRFGAIGADDIRGLGPAWRGRCSPLTLSKVALHRLLRALTRWASMISDLRSSLAHPLARLSPFLVCFAPAASRFDEMGADGVQC